MVMIGTKIDQAHRIVSESEAKEVQEEVNIAEYCEISSVSTGLNIGDSPINLIS